MINENISFNKEKFKALIQYIVSRLHPVEENIIYKLAYFSDFNFYELYENALTGEIYVHKDTGPVPKDFIQIKNELIMEGKIKDFYICYFCLKNQN